MMLWNGSGMTMATAMLVVSEVIYVSTADGAVSRIVVHFSAPVLKTTTDAAPQPVVNQAKRRVCRCLRSS